MYNYTVNAENQVKGTTPPNSLSSLAEYTSAGVPIERNPQIAEQLQNLERELQFQQEVIGGLFAKLQPVMSPVPPDCATEKSAEPTCQLANVLARFTSKLQSNSASLSEIVRRLEI